MKTYWLSDAERRHKKFPDTFELLPLEERRGLKVGNVAKLAFVTARAMTGAEAAESQASREIADEISSFSADDTRFTGERMWVEVTEVGQRAGQAVAFKGVLANDPVLIQDLKYGDVVEFGPENVMEVAESR